MFFLPVGATNLFISWCVGEMAEASDVDSDVSHVSNSFSDSEEICDSPTFSEMEEACHELSELAQLYEAPPQSEEEDEELYPPEEEAYRARNWAEACQWCASDNMFETVAYNVTPYFHPNLNLGKDSLDGPWDPPVWDIVECDRIADILKLRPREGCTRDQMRIEYVKGWVSHLRGDDTGKWTRGLAPFCKFRLYDGSNTIRVTIRNDHNTHANVTHGVLREGCVVVLYWVTCFVRGDAPPRTFTHRLSAGFSNILAIFS